MDKKLILYLLVLAGLIFLTVRSARYLSEEEGLTSDDKEVLIETGYFENDPNTGEFEALFVEDLSLEELSKGEEPTAALEQAYSRFQGVENKGSPIMTFIFFVLSGILAGFLVVTYALPSFVQTASEEVFGSTEAVGENPLTKAQAMVAQGKWKEAINAYRDAASEDETNRLPWVEMAMLTREKLEDSRGAVGLLDEAIERGGWRENDEAFFIFRKIEILQDDLEEHDSAVNLLREVIEKFPQTRHSANAMHKLHELGES